MVTLTAEQRARLPKDVARAPAPPSPTNPAAFDKLVSILADAMRVLSTLDADPIVIVASPNRFNDSDWSEWRAIRFEKFFTEQNDYATWTPHDYERELAHGPAGARTARQVLDRLEADNWRYLFSDAFGIAYTDQVLALVLQDEIPWLVFSSSNAMEENHVFALWGKKPLWYFGECIQRFDQEMDESPPLKFEQPEVALQTSGDSPEDARDRMSLRALTEDQRSRLPKNVLRALPPPAIEDSMAFIELKVRLEDALLELSRLEANPIVIAASPNRFNDARWSEWRAIRFGSFFTEEPPYPLHDHIDYERDLARGPEGSRAADRVLDALEANNWRNLFSDAFGLDWTGEVLALVIQDGIPWLVFGGYSDEHHVFALWGEQSLRYFGECVERFDWEIQESPPLKFQTSE